MRKRRPSAHGTSRHRAQANARVEVAGGALRLVASRAVNPGDALLVDYAPPPDYSRPPCAWQWLMYHGFAPARPRVGASSAGPGRGGGGGGAARPATARFDKHGQPVADEPPLAAAAADDGPAAAAEKAAAPAQRARYDKNGKLVPNDISATTGGAAVDAPGGSAPRAGPLDCCSFALTVEELAAQIAPDHAQIAPDHAAAAMAARLSAAGLAPAFDAEVRGGRVERGLVAWAAAALGEAAGDEGAEALARAPAAPLVAALGRRRAAAAAALAAAGGGGSEECPALRGVVQGAIASLDEAQRRLAAAASSSSDDSDLYNRDWAPRGAPAAPATPAAGKGGKRGRRKAARAGGAAGAEGAPAAAAGAS